MAVILPPVPNVIKTVVSGTTGGNPFNNIFHWQYTAPGPPTAGAVSLLCQNIHNAYNTNLTTWFPSWVNVLQTTGTDLTSTSGAVGSYAHTQSGGGATGTGSSASCVLVKHLISRRYRGGHPRTYLPGLTSSDQADSLNWDAAHVADIQTGFNGFLSAVETSPPSGITSLNFVNVSYYGHGGSTTKPPTPLPTPIVDVITGNVVEARLATQRRRLGR